MKLLCEYIRAIFISFEFLVLMVTGAVLYYHPTTLDRLPSALNLTPDVLKWFALVPATCMVMTFSEGRKVLFPHKDKKDLVQKWDEYWRLRVTINVALLYAVFFTVLALPAWIVKDPRYTTQALVLMASAIVGAGIDYLSVYNAETTINEAVAQTSRNAER